MILRRARPVAGAADRVAAASRAAARPRRSRSCARWRSRPRRPRAATLDGRPFEWIADADSRLGPVLEAIINGRYYWVPFSRLARDRLSNRRKTCAIWCGCRRSCSSQNGGESVALIPTRYPGSAAADDGADRAGAQDRLGGDCAGDASRPRPAPPHHRRRRDARSWSPDHLARRGTEQADAGRRPRIMAEQRAPEERLQPALLDRLTDDEPDKKLEPRESARPLEAAPAPGGAARPRLAVQRHAARAGHAIRPRCR